VCLRARYPCRFSGAGPPPYDPLLTLGVRVWRYLLDELDLGEAEALLVRMSHVPPTASNPTVGPYDLPRSSTGKHSRVRHLRDRVSGVGGMRP